MRSKVIKILQSSQTQKRKEPLNLLKEKRKRHMLDLLTVTLL
jgi:hypothetical protein